MAKKFHDLNNPITKFHGKGDNFVEKHHYQQLRVTTLWPEAEAKGEKTEVTWNEKSVYINKNQYFHQLNQKSGIITSAIIKFWIIFKK
jgi:hypothetical protein